MAVLRRLAGSVAPVLFLTAGLPPSPAEAAIYAVFNPLKTVRRCAVVAAVSVLGSVMEHVTLLSGDLDLSLATAKQPAASLHNFMAIIRILRQ